jgi:hypothetical protein
MEVFHAFVPDQIKGVMQCQISNSAEFDVQLKISGGLNVRSHAISIAALEILYRPAVVKKGCERIFEDGECECKILHKILQKSGIRTDFLKEVVPNMCTKKYVAQAEGEFHRIVSFDFQRKLENDRNVMIAGKDFGKLFHSLIFNQDLCKSNNASEERVFSFLQEHVIPGTKFLFLSMGKVIDQSTVPEYSDKIKSVVMRVTNTKRPIN